MSAGHICILYAYTCTYLVWPNNDNAYDNADNNSNNNADNNANNDNDSNDNNNDNNDNGANNADNNANAIIMLIILIYNNANNPSNDNNSNNNNDNKTVDSDMYSSWGQHAAHLEPTGPMWAPCWPHEPCYVGNDETFVKEMTTYPCHW